MTQPDAILDHRDALRWRKHIQLLFRSKRHSVSQVNETILAVDREIEKDLRDEQTTR